MFRYALIAVCLLPSLCKAETRWCVITGIGAADKLRYPPIAKAAHVAGTVIERVMFQPSGAVTHVEVVLGPSLLAKLISNQLLSWSFQTNATGNDLCQALVVADFAFEQAESETGNLTGTSMYKDSLRAVQFVTRDEMPVLGRRRFWW